MGTDDDRVGFDWRAQLERTAPAFAAVAGDERPGWLRERGSGGEPAEMRSIVLRVRPEPDWVDVATWFPGSRERADDFVWSHLADRVGLVAAQPGDGEAYRDGEAMWARVEAFEAIAHASWTPATLVLGGAVVPASRATAGDFELVAAQLTDGTVVSVTRPLSSEPVLPLAWRSDWPALRQGA